jgi:hypothetical protein
MLDKVKLALVVLVLALFPARPAHALKACSGEHGWAPTTGTTLLPHARLVWFTDGYRKDAKPEVTATIEGKPVKTEVTRLANARPYVGFVVQIDSDATGTLEVELAGMHARYEVRKDAPRPGEVHGTLDTLSLRINYTAIPETYDGAMFDLDVAAVLAHVKLRADAKAAWQAFDVPVMPDPTYDKSPSTPEYPKQLHTVPIGELGCERNYRAAAIAAGVDLEISVTLADGRTLPVQDLPAHVRQ